MHESRPPSFEEQIRMTELLGKVQVLFALALQIFPDLALLETIHEQADDRDKEIYIDQVIKKTGIGREVLEQQYQNGRDRIAKLTELVRMIGTSAKSLERASGADAEKNRVINESMKNLGIL